VHDVEFKGAPTWFEDNPAFKEGGLCHLPLTYEPPLGPGEKLAVVCEREPQGLGLVRCWRQAEPARRLVNIAGIPVVIVRGRGLVSCALRSLHGAVADAGGVANTFIRLADRGIRGNGHMMMLEQNNAEIAGVVADWLDGKRGLLGPSYGFTQVLRTGRDATTANYILLRSREPCPPARLPGIFTARGKDPGSPRYRAPAGGAEILEPRCHRRGSDCASGGDPADVEAV